MTHPHEQHDSLRAIEWRDERLWLLDQRLLAQQAVYLSLEDAGATAQAIRDMVVRGAPAIGITAAFAVVMAARARYGASAQTWRADIEADLQQLAASRPTAVNLFWALARMREAIQSLEGDPYPPLLQLAQRLHEEDIAANYRMGELGAAYIDGEAVMTHCNTGSLATGGYGTALGVIRKAYTLGHIKNVYAGETRPWLQGARLTAWELVRDHIPVTLVCEGAAASLMRQGKIRWVVVGADRIAANGDVANKIGTYSLAVLARHHGVRFMVVAPVSTVDMQTPSGDAIPIEERPPEEVLMLAGQAVAAQGAQAWNPAFDVTPAGLIDVIVTERGVVEQPSREGMSVLMGENTAVKSL